MEGVPVGRRENHPFPRLDHPLGGRHGVRQHETG